METRLALLAELQDQAVFERHGDDVVADPYRGLERDTELVGRWLAFTREATAERWPVDAEVRDAVAAADAPLRVRTVATVGQTHATEVATNQARSLRLARTGSEPSLPLSGALAWSASPNGQHVAMILAPTGALPSPHLMVYDWSGVVVDGPVADVVPTAPAWEGDDVLLYVLTGRGRATLRRRFVGAGNDLDPVVLTELREGDAIRLDAIPDGPAWVEAQRGEERSLWLRTGPTLFRRVPDQPAGPAATLAGDHLVIADPAGGRLRFARTSRALRATGWSELPLPGVGAITTCGREVLAVVRRGIGDALVSVDVATGRVHELDSLGLGLVASLDGDANGAWVTWTDPLTPSALVRVSATGELTFDREGPRLEVHRKTIEATNNGETVHFELAEVRLASETPSPLVVLEAHGAFGVSALPAYRAGVAAYLRRGGRWAFADVRGGGGHASPWHEAGRGAGESGAVADLKAAVEALRADGATVALYGMGHGGLTAAGLLAREPQLVSGAVLHGPVADLLRFDRLPNAALWRSEYGDPSDAEAWAWLRALSPYHRVRPESAWPPTLVEGAREGERVSWIHGAKLAARLLEAERAWLHVDATLDDDARHARWARAVQVFESLARTE
ncbi:MAG: prolyl oligopeptidase family serine peptidase [Polyangiales bacterium]